MNKLLLLFTILLLSTTINTVAEGCNSDITLTTQQEVDDFSDDYSTCFLFGGKITIQGTGITNLSGLSGLTLVNNFVIIRNTSITSLSGLNNLVSVKSIIIDNNPNLTDLTGLSSLSSISNNFTIKNNAALTSLNGFSGTPMIQNFHIQDNASLTSLSGNSISGITGNIRIERNPLLTAVDNITVSSSLTGSIILNDLPAMTSAPAFSGVTSIGASLILLNCDVLPTLNDFGSVSSISQDFILVSNDLLTTLGPIQNADLSGATSIMLSSNSALATCDFTNVCNALDMVMSSTVFANASGSDCEDETALDNACASALPIELLSFSGRLVDDIALLSWSTTNELNNAFFEVQHSTDGVHFETVGKVEGNGTTQTINDYNFEHTASKGDNYYRLKQVDFDGTAHLHKTITFYVDSKAVILAPNPVSDWLTVDTESPIDITVINHMGQVLFTKHLEAADIIDFSHLPANIYFVQIKEGRNISTQKIIKSN